MAIEYTLKTPIVIGEETTETLTLEEPNTKRLELFNVSFAPETLASVVQMSAILCACATNVNEAHIAEMKARDLTAAWSECYSAFFG